MKWTRKFFQIAAPVLSSTPATDFMPVLSPGGHSRPEEGACFMEYISVLRGETFDAYSESVNPFIAALARALNDYSTSNRRMMIDLMGPAMSTGTGQRSSNLRRGIELEMVASRRGITRYNNTVGDLAKLIDLYHEMYGTSPHVITNHEVANVVKVGLPA